MSDEAQSPRASGPLQSPASRYVLKRFAIKFTLILFFALAQTWTPWGFADGLATLAIGSVIIDVGLALLLRQPIRGPDLSYWDEALAFAAIAILAGFWWHTPPSNAPAANVPAASGAATIRHFR